ncbi:1-deoxy-D-xylulose 5-phosphate reductoisomerase [Alicyclobacillus hesperidum URH17-3-68]|uniref:1-deoxy-D-xylulose-5-phosphate reductoisomerase n=1 Tax=Alicyclobacillus hesperidum TaxID=89784 RepID=UPI000281B8CD|nr:1-deoxy-D-xylulose-5-phosphate reductoisomerase [Alicyclobacillus hesperidum]EJY55613.1 1-deoxy-D-xylulose 5-phosphate reductoisomerase [Alicyclobacillus hesperidum URH17-3-68]
MTYVTILGSTGAIGTRTLAVLSALGDTYQVAGLAAGHNVELLAEQIRRFHPQLVAVADDDARKRLLSLLGTADAPEVLVGDEGLLACASMPAQVVVNAVMGARGILPAMAVVRQGARLALANKECLVAAGTFIMREAIAAKAEIVPVDSEHCALHQCMQSGRPSEVRRWILTASGGPFRTWPRERLASVTVADALKHPNWNMGKKITVDSATMMNKGLEVIEAHHLFAAPYDKIAVLVHPESIVHSLVEYEDGSLMAQLATHDMRLPIQYAVTYPERVDLSWPRLDLAEVGRLTFEDPDFEKFPALRLAMDAGRAGGYAPCVLNAANEVAVDAFLRNQISYSRIASLVADVLDDLHSGSPSSIDDVLHMDGLARERARLLLTKG